MKTAPTQIAPPTTPPIAGAAGARAERIVKTAMRIPVALRSQLKAEAALKFPTLNALYVRVLSEFLHFGLDAPRREWLKPQALKTQDGVWCQVPLHIPEGLEKALTEASETAQVSLASVYCTAMSEYAARAVWSSRIKATLPSPAPRSTARLR